MFLCRTPFIFLSGFCDFSDPERKRKKDLLKKNKWVLSRIAGFGVKANVVDDVTQAQFLKEAEKTEKANLESLRR